MRCLQVKHVLSRTGVVVALWGIVPAMASAQNLLTNGSFESGLAGWTMNRNDCSSFVNSLFVGPAFSGTFTPAPGSAEDGLSDMGFGAATCTPGISQELTTIAGRYYTLDFWFVLGPRTPPNTPNVFTISLNGNVLASGQVNNYFPWQELGGEFLGTGDDIVSFSGNNPKGVTFLDNVRVTAVTPEPETLTLFATGMVGLLAIQRRRRKA